jgi:hypothetical protein
MTQDEINYATIKNTIRILSVMCAGDETKIIHLLTGYLWDEEEAGRIKESDGRFDIKRDVFNKIKQHEKGHQANREKQPLDSTTRALS